MYWKFGTLTKKKIENFSDKKLIKPPIQILEEKQEIQNISIL